MELFLANIIFKAFGTSSFFNQSIAVLLIVLSLFMWTTISGKFGDLRISRNRNVAFRKNLQKHYHPALVYLEMRGIFAPGIPMAAVYRAAMKEFVAILHRKGLTDEQILALATSGGTMSLTETEMASIKAIAEGELSEQTIFIESRMSWIATLTSAAPSIGLLGTVWGVMESFMAMVSAGSAMITSVAPGIAGSLLTTVFGLIVAIPSSVSYNILGDRVKELTVKTENFTDELLADIARLHVSAPLES